MKRHHTTQINCAFVKVRRKRIGITQRAAAKRAGISFVHWCNIENARARPGIEVVIRMANALRCRPDELLTSTSEVSINYLEQRMQETIQSHAEPSRETGVEPLETKEFLIIAKMLGYFDRLHKRPEIGYDRAEHQQTDDQILSQYHTLFELARSKTGVDMLFLEFAFIHRHQLRHLLTSEQQAVFGTYLSERGLNPGIETQEALGGKIETT